MLWSRVVGVLIN